LDVAHHLEKWADGGRSDAEREHLDDLLAHFQGVVTRLLVDTDNLVVRLVSFVSGIFRVTLLKLSELVRETHGPVLCSAKIRCERLVHLLCSFQLLRRALQLGFGVDRAALRPHAVGLGSSVLGGQEGDLG
jgi:hypothetical protein